MRYLIICKERGVFLGTYENSLFFSKIDDFGCYKVPSFANKNEAVEYSKKFMDTENHKFEYIYPEFKTKEKYVTCIDIIKAGYGDHTGDMIDNIPYASETMH